MYREYDAALEAWRESRPPVSGPAAVEWRRVRREAERTNRTAATLRRKLMKIPTRSPRGVVIKVAVAVSAGSLDDTERMTKELGGDYRDLLLALLRDLQAMAGRAVA
jgi:hypothetical protein